MRLKIVFVSFLLLNGCMATVQHPGAINSTDNAMYDALITEQAAINQALTQIGQFPKLKPALNIVIEQYDTSMAAYKVYHVALTQGTNPDPTILQKQINDLIANVAALIKGMTPVPPVVPVPK